jgi:hypothetical protein
MQLTPTVHLVSNDEKAIYTPVTTIPARVRLPRKTEFVSIEDLVANPEKYAGKFIEVHGVNQGTLGVPLVVCWVRPPWEWRVDAGPVIYDDEGNVLEQPPGIDVKNTFGDELQFVANSEGYTIKNPYGKRVAVWGWWRLFKGQWGCPKMDASGNPVPAEPHWYLDAIQIQFLEKIEVTPPTLYKAISAIAISGNTLYIGEDSGITILDVSDPARPVHLSQIPLQGLITGIQVVDQRAFVISAPTAMVSSGLWIVDVSNSKKPAILGSQMPFGTPVDISIAGEYAYVADFAQGLRILDFRDPTHITDRGRYITTGTANSMQVVDHLIFLADRGYVGDSQPGSGLQIIDVSDPDRPILQGNYALVEGGVDVQVIGALAYVIEDRRGVHILDIHDTAHPVFRGKYERDGELRKLFLAGNLLYNIAYGELLIVDTSNPDYPMLIGKADVSDGTDILVQDNIAYIATWKMGLLIFDVSDPSNPKLLGTYGLPE